MAYQRRNTALAPAEFEQSCRTVQGKAPVLKEGMLILLEVEILPNIYNPNVVARYSTFPS